MGQYGKAAIQATNLFVKESITSPNKAWDTAIKSISSKVSSQEKGCPRNAYLGLCEEGLIKGIPKGKYCNSEDNKRYALIAIDLLKECLSLLQISKPWKLVVQKEKENGSTPPKNQNGQMEVVISLWENNLIL